MKIVETVLESCDDCPMNEERWDNPENEVTYHCYAKERDIPREDVDDFPSWCPLEDVDIEIEVDDTDGGK